MVKRLARRWYVIATHHPWRAILCGPFDTERAAIAMIEPVRHACDRHATDPRYRTANYGARLCVGAKPGTMPLDWLDPADVIEASRRKRSWDDVFSDLRKTEHGSYVAR